ncbi:MAG: CpaD family pilus assembly protein [Pseudomonadota bacterium]|nr:CpaD family pilus assembly protein [Pseudomonadota bacterium]
MLQWITKSERKGRRLVSGLCLGAAALSLSGCLSGVQYASDNQVSAIDYHERHPIVLGKAATTLDLFPVGGRLDALSADKVKAFAERYGEFGSGEVTILTPAGDGASARIVPEIRKQLYANGLRGYVAVGSYPVQDATLASPIRLVFQGLKAKVADRCGQWPTDLASGSSIESWKNQSYPNFGCATQSALAAQVDDPRDLAQARASSPPDENMRLRAIQNVRKGFDPGTDWKTQTTTIGTVGGG